MLRVSDFNQCSGKLGLLLPSPITLQQPILQRPIPGRVLCQVPGRQVRPANVHATSFLFHAAEGDPPNDVFLQGYKDDQDRESS